MGLLKIKNLVILQVFLLLTLLKGSLIAQDNNPNTAPDILAEIGIDQRLDEKIPLDLVFQNEAGESVQLSKYFGEKPVILALVYYECPMLCTMILNGLLESINTLKFDVGEQFGIVTVSFDPDEGPALAEHKKTVYVSQYGRDGAEKGWHFLTGDEAAIRELADAVGFHYKHDPETDQYVHASGIMLLTPEGKLSRYFYGVEYSPRDLKLGLVEASSNKIGSPVDQILLYCYHYDPTTGKYGVAIMNIIRILGTLTVVILGTFMVIMLRRDKAPRA